MKRKLLGPSIIIALAITAAPAFAQAVNTVDGLRDALANPTAGGTITINGTIDASGGTMNDPTTPSYNTQYPYYGDAMRIGAYSGSGARVYFGGVTWGDQASPSYGKSTVQAVSGLTLQGTNNATLTRNPGTLTGDYQFAYGTLMELDYYEDLTLQDLTLKGGKEIRKTNNSGGTTMADYGGAAVFNSNTGDLTFNRVNIADNWIEAVKQADTTEISVGAGGMRVIQSENVIFNGTKFTGNTAKLTDADNPSDSAGGSPNFAAEAGGLYVSTFKSLNFTGTNDKDFSGNTVDATNASANGGALVVRIDKDTEEAAVNFKDVEFTDNMAKATISSTISDYTVARGGAASFRTDNLGTGNGPDLGVTLTNVNVHGNTAEVVQGTGGSLGSGGVTGAEGGGFNFSGYTTTVIENSQFDNNEAVSALGQAYGGAIYSSATANDTSKKALTVTDTDFTNNRVNGDTDAKGGAVYSAEDITISAVNKDVLFSGNTAQIGSSAATADSVYALKNVVYNAADGRTITDNDKITVDGDLTKDGAGNLIANEAVIQNALMINDGVAVFKTVSAPSTAINGDAILGVDGRSASLGGITFGDAKARLIVAGNCTDTSCIVGTLGNPGQKNR